MASSVAAGEGPVLGNRRGAGIRLQSPSSRSSNLRARWVTGREFPSISCIMRSVLTAAESAVMHIISADTGPIIVVL